MHLEGSCHCGAVTFSVEAHSPVPFMHCHCSICRKTAGSGGYAINLGEGHIEHAAYVFDRSAGAEPETATDQGRRDACLIPVPVPKRMGALSNAASVRLLSAASEIARGV